MTLDYIGFKPHKAGRIHLFCPNCRRKMSNVIRTEYDPKRAVLAHLPCERCSIGCKVDGPSLYLDAAGRAINRWEEEGE